MDIFRTPEGLKLYGEMYKQDLQLQIEHQRAELAALECLLEDLEIYLVCEHDLVPHNSGKHIRCTKCGITFED